MSADQNVSTRHAIASDFDTYEEYLDSQVTSTDLFYLEDRELARRLVEFGYRGTGEPLKRDEFDTRKRAVLNTKQTNRWRDISELSSKDADLSASPFLEALAAREEANRLGSIATIIFIRTKNKRNQEVSGYIDYAHRLKSDVVELYFQNKRRLLPRVSDLSYYNWETQDCTATNSPNWQVITENVLGLQFRNKRNRKVVEIKINKPTIEDTTRKVVKSPEYTQVVFYDHYTRRKI